MEFLKSLKINSSGRQTNKIGMIGIEFSRNQMHLAQMQQHASECVVYRAKATADYLLASNLTKVAAKELKSKLSGVLKQAKFKGKKAVIALPKEMVRLMSLSYRLNEGEAEAQAILKQLKNRLEEDLSHYVVDYVPVRSNEANAEQLAIVSIARNDQVVQFLDFISNAGIQVEALEISPIAVRRLIEHIPKSDFRENCIVISFGKEQSSMTLISGRRLLSDQTMICCEDQLMTSFCNEIDADAVMVNNLIEKYGFEYVEGVTEDLLSLSGQEIVETLQQIAKGYLTNFVDDINRVLIYAASEIRGEQVTKVYLLGGMARWKGIDKLINKLIGIPTEVVNPLTAFAEQDNRTGTITNNSATELAVATGLALRGMKVQQLHLEAVI